MEFLQEDKVLDNMKCKQTVCYKTQIKRLVWLQKDKKNNIRVHKPKCKWWASLALITIRNWLQVSTHYPQRQVIYSSSRTSSINVQLLLDLQLMGTWVISDWYQTKMLKQLSNNLIPFHLAQDSLLQAIKEECL